MKDLCDLFAHYPEARLSKARAMLSEDQEPPSREERGEPWHPNYRPWDSHSDGVADDD